MYICVYSPEGTPLTQMMLKSNAWKSSQSEISDIATDYKRLNKK